MDIDIDKAISTVLECRYLEEPEFRYICEKVKEILIEENNVQPITSPVVICGDIHGQFYDLLHLFKVGGPIETTKYIFMGDYVDRGYYSIETFTYLLLLKIKYPENIILLRGNHETRQITQVYGFYDECIHKYGSSNSWRYCTSVFDYFSLAAIIDHKILCVHGGLSPQIRTIDQIRALIRMEEIPHEGPMSDLVWSDPDERILGWSTSPRGAGWYFGKAIADEFLNINKISLLCRSHQLVSEGYKYSFGEQKVLTIWSAPNYFYRSNNVASILKLNDEENRNFQIFAAVPDEERKIPPNISVPLFL